MTASAADMQTLYKQQGYLTAVPVLSDTELQAARAAFAELEREFGQEYTQYSLHNVHQQYDWVMALVKHPRVLEVVKTILGPDVLLLDSRFICKYPTEHDSTMANDTTNNITDGSISKNTPTLPYVAWHQDMRYWGLEGGPVLSVWLALDDSLKDNGALQVIPGSHCSGLLLHQTAIHAGNMLSVNQEIPEDLVQTARAIICPLSAGQISVHDGLLVHGSEPNMSDCRRCGFVMRFVPTCVYPVKDPDRPRRFFATVLVCGDDKLKHFSNTEAESI
ncbi:probable alpha-ketoglutarate-dependent hypophosphite dioxygenase [Brienomyrus brachyistius]|uniref:probable alpha-ketoglutarate-dependent hypophosphite dioxygenase n=1 Tax=Brienomyrus brachyistius TaxID=42636 RepID=UPI0020B3BD95|nr:probable alpha-ketoglutarate-dependent hypophosphite dioxygenase [Brienomyrus brachyistius]